MKYAEIKEYTGEIYNKIVQEQNIIIIAEKGKFFLSNRSPTLSDPSAIESVSDYGIAKVIWIGKSRILQPFINFEKIPLKLIEQLNLMKKIHQNKKGSLSLIHGDFSNNNLTNYGNEVKCFDYEHSHWGNPYVDIGRIILRECTSQEDIDFVLDNYFYKRPSAKELKQGFLVFCQRHYEMRHEKNQAFQEIPKLRAKRLLKSNLTLNEILHSFKDPVIL